MLKWQTCHDGSGNIHGNRMIKAHVCDHSWKEWLQWRHQDFKLGGATAGRSSWMGGAMQKFNAIRVSVLFNAICVLFINIGFCMFNKLIFFSTELFFFLISAIGRFICCSFRLQGRKVGLLAQRSASWAPNLGTWFNPQCCHVRQKFHLSHKWNSPHYSGPAFLSI